MSTATALLVATLSPDARAWSVAGLVAIGVAAVVAVLGWWVQR